MKDGLIAVMVRNGKIMCYIPEINAGDEYRSLNKEYKTLSGAKKCLNRYGILDFEIKNCFYTK